MDGNNEVERWGLYPWFPEHGVDLVHPEDLAAFKDFQPYCRVFRVTGGDEWMRLHYGNRVFRVRLSLLKEVPAPAVSFGDRVEVMRSDGKHTGIVSEIYWHHKRQEPFYILDFDRRKSSKRWFATDIVRSSAMRSH